MSDIITLEAREILDPFVHLNCRVELQDLVERSMRARIARIASTYIALNYERGTLCGRLSLLVPRPAKSRPGF